MKKLILLCILLAMFGFAFAVTVTVGTGTATSSNLPIVGLYGYTYSQQIYTQAQINATGNITKIRFYYVSGTIATSKDWVVYLGHTTKTTFASTTDWEPYANLTPVYAGDVTSLVPLANNWMEITLTTAFPYDNVRNLIVAVDENTAGYAFMSWGAFTSGANTGIYYRSDTVNPNPTAPPTAFAMTNSIDRIQMDISQPGYPDVVINPSPANNAIDIALSGNLTWTFGADTATYDLWFGPTGSMTQVVTDGTAGATGSYAYSGLSTNVEYSWQVISKNTNARFTTNGPVWKFKTVWPPYNVQIGTGVITTYGLPIDPYMGYSYSQVLYLQSELNIPDKRISKLYYYWSGAPAAPNSAAWKIWMGHTPNTAFASTTSWIPTTSMNLVFDGTVTLPATAGWIEIVLTTPFIYDNVNNLVVAVDENTPSYDSSSHDFYGTTVATNRSINYTNDTTNPDPATPPAGTLQLGIANARFQFEDVPALPVFSINPTATSWDFGTVLMNVPATKQYTITNTGGGTLTINSVVASGTEYSISEAPADLALTAGESTTFTVQYLPTADGGPYTGSVTVSYGRTDYVINLTGTCLDPTIYQLDLPYVQNFDGVTAPALPIDWSKKMVDTSGYGQVSTYAYVSHSASNSVQLYNSSDVLSDKILISPLVDPALSTVRVRFWLYGPTLGGIQVGTVDVPNNSAVFSNVQTVIPAVASTWAEYTVNFSGYSGPNHYIAFRHALGGSYQTWYVDDVTIEEPPLVPVISVTPTSWDFGNVDVTAPVTKVFTISNIGGADLVLSSVAANGLYYSITVPPATMTITPGNSTTFTVRFAPTVVGGPYTGDVTITDNRGITTVNLTGNGITRPAGSTCGNPYPVTLPLVAFAGDTSLYGDDYDYAMVTPNSYYITGDDMVLQFSLPVASTLSGDLSSPGTWIGLFILQQEPSIAVPAPVLRSATTSGSAVTMTPVILAAGSYFAIISSWPTPQSIAFTLNLSAVPLPVDPVFSITPPELTWDFGTIGMNTSATKVYTISNTGGGTLTINSVVATGAYYSISVAPTDLELAGGESTTFTVQFLPTVAGGPYTGSVTVTYGGTLTHVISLSGSAVDYTIYPPYSQTFGTALTDPFPPNAGWARFIGLPGTTLTPDTWNWQIDDWLNVAASNMAAKTNIYGTSFNYWLRTAPVDFTLLGNYALSFDMALMDWNYNTQPPLGESPDDKLVVYVSDNADMSGATILREWNNTGSPYVYENIPAAGSNNAITLTGYSGIKYFAWYGESTIDNGDNDLMIDNVSLVLDVAERPDIPILVAPAAGALNVPLSGPTFTWTRGVGGGIPDGYYFSIADDPDRLFMVDALENATVTGTSHNATITYAYDGVYYWAVKAYNSYGESAAALEWDFTIRSAPTAVTTFPWNEGFEDPGRIFPPTDWTTADVDGAGTFWMQNTVATYVHSGTKSAGHIFSTVPATGQDGWLITPAIIPTTGLNMVLSWWNYNYWPTYMVYNGLLVNTTNDPLDPNWVELWSAPTAAASWSNAVVNISLYGGQTVYFAFNYQGYDGDNWYVDDVSIYELTSDLIPPSITHLPVLNSPRDDAPYYVIADIADDTTWNNPIAAATMYYSINLGPYTPVAMTLDVAPTYYAAIPAQALNTQVDYYITAEDSEGNLATSVTNTFYVENPTWLWYDSGTSTNYLGYTTIAYGPMVMYENPFFGTGDAMLLNATDGAAWDYLGGIGTNANLHVYTWDGVAADPVNVITPIPVFFEVTTYTVFDLTTYNIQITDPYFFISYEDIPANHYFNFEAARPYGTSYVWQSGVLYGMGNPGTWCIGANVTNVPAVALDPPVVTITQTAGLVNLSWLAVAGASSYLVYGSDDPYAADPWTLLTTTALLSYDYTGTELFKFFKVVASSVTPPVRAALVTSPQINAPVITQRMETIRIPKLSTKPAALRK